MIKKKKKNKALPLLIMVGILIVFTVMYTVMKSANDKAEAERLAEEAAKNQVLTLAAFEGSELSSLSYTLADSDTITFKVSEGKWYLSKDKNFPLNSTIVTQMANSILSITANRAVTEGRMEDYGLDKPTLKIVAKYGEDSHEYRVGQYNAAIGAYYFMADGEMYLVSTDYGYYFNYDLDSLLLLDAIPADIDAEYFNSVTLSFGGNQKEYTLEEHFTSLETLIRSIPLTNCADYYAEEEELTEYGIAGEEFLTLNYKALYSTTDADGNTQTSRLDTTYTILFGKTTADGSVYAKPEKSSIVYLIPAETMGKFSALFAN